MWFWSIVILLVIILGVWWAITRQAGFTKTPTHSSHDAPDHSHDPHHDEHSSPQENHHEVHTETAVVAAEAPARPPMPAEQAVQAVPEPAPVPEPISAPVQVSAPEPVPAPESSPEPAASKAAVVTGDDLVIIEGIGPKISSVLKDAGVKSFNQLASLNPEQIKEILGKSNPNLLRLADPASWPDQAKLAASGDMEALKKMQDELKGGRAKS